MSISGIHGQLLEVTVVECSKLKDTEWISRQDPYVCLEYGSTKFRTRTCTDGGKNPIFQEKFVFTLIEGLREINVAVWNSNTLTYDDFIGGGKVLLEDVLSRGYDDRFWSLQTKTGRNAGSVKLIMHYASAHANAHLNRSVASITPSAPPYPPSPQPQVPMYLAPPVASMPHSNPTPAYPPPPSAAYPPPATASPSPSAAYLPPGTAYPPPTAYPPTSPHPYPPNPASYPPYPYAPPPDHSAYPPPTAYPPPPSVYHPPPHGSPYPPPGHYPGGYPPPPY